ncbi:MAG: hypothetical protein JW993_16690 [Sedimentisphaerales bacterium]|nr:hypothetical protein [Sedimentisphaerales bacterium]
MQAEERTEAKATVETICGLPVDRAILFADKKGIYRPRIEKGRTKLLQNLGFLSRFLDTDEKILLVTTGCSPFTTFEELTIGGAWVVAVKRALFVFTHKRLFHIPATSSFKYRGSIAQVLYQDCARLRVKGSALIAEYHNGRKEKFLFIPRGDRAIIERFAIEPNESDRPSENPQRNHLCPCCTQILPASVEACPACGQQFKTRAKALKYSLLIPGGGYFYTNHLWMGLADALAETYLLVATVVAFAMALRGNAEAWPAAIIFAFVSVLEKALTVHHSNSFLAEFIPDDLKSHLGNQPPRAEPGRAPSTEDRGPRNQAPPRGRPVLAVSWPHFTVNGGRLARAGPIKDFPHFGRIRRRGGQSNSRARGEGGQPRE